MGIFIFGYYFINYPEEFHLVEIIKDAEWKIFSLIIFAIFISSVVLAFLPIKKYRFGNRFLTILAGLNALFISFLIFKGFNSFLNNKKGLDHLILDYKKKAADDMKAGLITIEYGGGFLMPPDEKEQKMKNEIDSLTQTYGLIYQHSGCIISASLTKAQEEYRKCTKPYLDKRNGSDWEAKMEKQIAKIVNNCR